ncbi:hypothetical protein [Arvimicrobium flavum]|uniref:hypothetical protein n=1 Tax=Arvimicrobium flavum TaxID=3393320 RepID=UPI00237ADA9B|nr:hypothetical protein [Mesorhizobium shangrilense]
MIESALFFALGFLCAAFLALMIAPAIWRRAVNLTRRRIEASVPLTLNELQADKDRLRAEFAMTTRRLEMNLKEAKQKLAEQSAEVARNRDTMKRLTAERDEGAAASAAHGSRSAEIAAELHRREEQLQETTGRLDEANRSLEARALELKRLNGLFDEATLAASGRQIELAARESEVEKLSDDLSRAARDQREADRRFNALDVERKSSTDALGTEKKRAADLQAKIDSLMSTAADREEKLDRRSRELARLRDRLKDLSDVEVDLGEKLTEANAERFKLESQVAELTEQLASMPLGAGGEGGAGGDMATKGDRTRMETRLATLLRENKRLRAQLGALETSAARDSSAQSPASASLREQISNLAAEVVNMAIMLGDSDSDAAKAIAQAPDAPRPVDADGKVVVSLADRVRALQKAAASKQ